MNIYHIIDGDKIPCVLLTPLKDFYNPRLLSLPTKAVVWRGLVLMILMRSVDVEVAKQLDRDAPCATLDKDFDDKL